VQTVSRGGAVGVAVEDERGHVDLRQVVAPVGQPRGDAGGERYRRGTGGEVPLG
jgi:hypothetical protein